MSSITCRDLLLLLLGLDDPEREGLGGITRLQKYVFLLEKEAHVKPTRGGFEFTPYKAGPYSSRLYDDLEFLENLGFIESEVTAESTEEESAEVDYTFEDLIEPEQQSEQHTKPEADAYEERRFFVTDKGKVRVKQLLEEKDYAPIVGRICGLRKKFGKYSLNDLLYYVYKRYPEMTTESEIREKVLRRYSRQ
jgi:uncharacterized protein YwgA